MTICLKLLKLNNKQGTNRLIIILVGSSETTRHRFIRLKPINQDIVQLI